MPLVDKGNLSRCASLQWPGLPLRLGQLQHGNLHGPWCLPQRFVCMTLSVHTSFSINAAWLGKPVLMLSEKILVSVTMCVHINKNNAFDPFRPCRRYTLWQHNISQSNTLQCFTAPLSASYSLLKSTSTTWRTLAEVIQALVLQGVLSISQLLSPSNHLRWLVLRMQTDSLSSALSGLTRLMMIEPVPEDACNVLQNDKHLS